MLDWLLAPFIGLAVLAAIFVPLERAFPARRGQRLLRRELGTDLTFFFGQYWLFTLGSTYLLSRLAPLFGLGPLGALHAWVATQPIWLGALIALFAGDLCVYWFHRACHQSPLLWRFHAVHHSAEALDFVAAHREHPVDGLLTQIAINLPALALGLPFEALAPLVTFRAVWAVFIHSNVTLPLGPLRWLVGSPEWHHLHHKVLAPGEPCANFGNLAPYLDLLFGTHASAPDDAPGEERYPLGLDHAWPRGYFAQLTASFVVPAASLSAQNTSPDAPIAPMLPEEGPPAPPDPFDSVLPAVETVVPERYTA